MYIDAGVEFHLNRGADIRPRFQDGCLIAMLDWDATIAYENVVHAAEQRAYSSFQATRGLLPFEALSEKVPGGFDLLYSPLVTYEVMRAAGQAPCKREHLLDYMVRPFLDLHLSVENCVKPHEGAYEALTEMRRKNEGAYFVILTMCPWYLALGRTDITGLTGCFDGIVGVRRERPIFLQEYPEVQIVDRWVDERMRRLDLRNYRVIAGVPETMAKPRRCHDLMALGSVKVGLSNVIVGVDDRPNKMEGVVDRYRPFGPAFYVQAKVSNVVEALPGQKVDGEYHDMSELPPLVESLMSEAKGH